MPRYELNLHIDNIGSRNDIRMKVVNELAKELPGEVKNELASKYTYYVETLNDHPRKHGFYMLLRVCGNIQNQIKMLSLQSVSQFQAVTI